MPSGLRAPFGFVALRAEDEAGRGSWEEVGVEGVGRERTERRSAALAAMASDRLSQVAELISPIVQSLPSHM